MPVKNDSYISQLVFDKRDCGREIISRLIKLHQLIRLKMTVSGTVYGKVFFWYSKADQITQEALSKEQTKRTE